MRICIFSPFFLCLDEHGLFVHIYTAANKSRELEKRQTLLSSGRGGPWEPTFFNVTRQKSPKLFLIKTAGTRRKCFGNEKLFSSAELHEIFSTYRFFCWWTMVSCMQEPCHERDIRLACIPLWILISFLGCFVWWCIFILFIPSLIAFACLSG